VSKTVFTPAQQQAIDCDATNILVSAAAGSGKTAVLTERILRHVQNGVSIDNLLVVTFTESASAEMRERIGKKLQDYNRHDQVARLSIAQISTIHSFCRKLVQENFQLVDIDPGFRVGDTAELSLIRAQVMNELFEAEYENSAFLDLVDVYGGKTSDGRLDDLVRRIHDFMESAPFPLAKSKSYAQIFDIEDIAASPWAKIAREELVLVLQDVIFAIAQCIDIASAPDGPEKYLERLHENFYMLEDMQELANDAEFEEMYRVFTSLEWGSLSTKKSPEHEDPDKRELVKEIRNAAKARLTKLVADIFFAPPQKLASDVIALQPRVRALMELCVKFSQAYALEKRTRNLLDFSDLEHFAIQILYPNGPEDMTPAALYNFHEVLIDEYQDSNEVQDYILSAVAQRRFMVGDVKQSIYRFRRAEPKLFREKYRNFAPVEFGGDSVRIDLSHNFRSRPEVLRAVNYFFERLMDERVGEVTYDHAAALHPGHDEYPKSPNDTQMWVEFLDQHTDEEEDDETETVDNVVAETRMIAKCINELLESRQVWDDEQKAYRPCKLGDIAVLTRGLSSVAVPMVEELKSHGIDAIADMDAGFLQQLEIKTALAFLRITDNPRQDIELITALHSPVYGFTEDELLQIALCPLADEMPDACFYDHLLAFVGENPSPGRHHTFLRDLESWREAALHLPISRLIGLIYNSTRYPSHVLKLPGGAIRQANLRLLLERAIEFEETSLRGLFHFVNYIERLYESGTKTSGALAEPSPSPDGRVRIMTIHKSKGLEFPVVICAFLGKIFNTDDTRQPVILHSELGVGPYYVNSEQRTRANTLARFSLSRLSARENLSEEMRCLYVALTRAKELLVLTARHKNLERAIEKLPTYNRSTARSFLDWMLPCLFGEENEPQEIFRIRKHKVSDLQPGNALGRAKDGTNFNTLTPHMVEEAIPSKLSISEIKRMYNQTPDSTSPMDDFDAPLFNPPTFIQKDSAPTAMQVGSAMHTVIEYLDFSAGEAQIDGLIARLQAKNLLDEDSAALVNRHWLTTLLNSDLAARMSKSPKIYRETPFIMALPAEDMYQNAAGEEVLVHGIVDCFFEEDGELVLVDYKSDANPQRHVTQLEIYKKAIENSMAMVVKEVLIYSFALGKAIALPASSP